MRAFTLFLSLVAVAVSVAPQHAAALTGTWSGSYTCPDQRDGRFRLDLEEARPGFSTGILQYSYMKSGRRTSDAYRIEGRVGDGRFQLSPADNLTGSSRAAPTDLRGEVSADLAQIRGDIVGRGPGARFTGETAALANTRPAAPPDMARPAGLWQGELICEGPRKAVVRHAAQLVVLSDAGRITAELQLVPADDTTLKPDLRYTPLTGPLGQDGLTLENPENGAGTGRVREIRLRGTGDALHGSAEMPRCGELALQRTGPVPQLRLPAGVHGRWGTVADPGRQEVAMDLQISEAGLAELWVRASAHLPAVDQQSLRLQLVALRDLGGSVLLVPLTLRHLDEGAHGRRRQRSALFDDLRNAQSFLVQTAPDGQLALAALPRNLDPLLQAPELRDGGPDTRQGVFLLDPASARGADPGLQGSAVAVLPMPPLPGGIGGALADAADRAAGCAVLAAWLQPFDPQGDPMRIELGRLQRSITAAFADPVFVPVFGQPFTQLLAEERRALGSFMGRDCGQGRSLALVRVVGEQFFGRDGGFKALVGTLREEAETAAWADRLRQDARLAVGSQIGTKRITELRRELSRRHNLPPELVAGLEQTLTHHQREITFRDLQVRVSDQLAKAELQDPEPFLYLAGVIYEADLADPMRDNLLEQLRRAAEAPARAATDRALAAASAAPTDLDGLEQLTAILRVEQPRAGRISVLMGRGWQDRASSFWTAMARSWTLHFS